MARLVNKVNGYRIYELDVMECKKHGRSYPTFVTWNFMDTGNMDMTENETSTIAEMEKWCKQR